MLQNIKEIGIFMILAQAVVHFAPGRQYEKYIKSISGVIILLLFLKPFVQMAGGQWQDPAASLAGVKAAKMPELSAGPVNIPENGVEDAVVKHMEEEIAARLNRELKGEDCVVKQVRLIYADGTDTFGEEASFSVVIVIGERGADERRITVEEIRAGEGKEQENEALEAYRQRFAGFLELDRERVEVRWDG